MKIVSYNLRAGGTGCVHWQEVIERYSPSVLLVQESFPPKEHLPAKPHEETEACSVWAPAFNANGNRKWGSGAYIPNCSANPIRLPKFNGWVVGAEVEGWKDSPAKSKKTRFFSLHAPGHMGSYQKVVNEILNCLLAFREDAEIVIGGDFNLTVSERHSDEERTTSNADRKIQTRLKDEFGLINCWQHANPDTPLSQTLRWGSKKEVTYHCDGIFVPRTWASSLKSCEVVSGDLWDGLSDHNPVIAEFTP
jgi:exonuclease III